MKINFGYSELRQIIKFEDGRAVFYGYRIDYNGKGVEIRRSFPVRLLSVGWSNGKDFTVSDLQSLEEQ